MSNRWPLSGAARGRRDEQSRRWRLHRRRTRRPRPLLRRVPKRRRGPTRPTDRRARGRTPRRRRATGAWARHDADALMRRLDAGLTSTGRDPRRRGTARAPLQNRQPLIGAAQERAEPFHRQPHLADDRAERALRHFGMIRDDDAAVGRVPVPEDHVAATLAVERVAERTERFHDRAAGDGGALPHAQTSTSSSVIGGGTGSPCSSRLST